VNLHEKLMKIGKLLWIGAASCWVFAASAADPDAEAELQAGLDAWQTGDMIGAMNHYHVAAEAGIALAQAKLGYIYDQSNDDEEAVRWYREAAAQQHPDGEFGLGEMYAKGEGVEQDFDVAVEMYMRAAVGGHAQARRILASAYEDGGLGREVSQAEALRWLTLAADSGDINAMNRMASLYRDGGLGVEPDAAKADQWQARAEAAQAQ
jgi:TPR repeat protein